MTQPPSLLDQIESPADLRRLPLTKLPELARELRGELLRVVAANGGHLASNLGIVELTIALLRVFGDHDDRIVWDTGHQAYTYKLLTGRRQLFQSLRQHQGCCGFPTRQESRFDIFGAGHAGTAISAATGLTVARECMKRKGRVIAVVGDGALGCGVSLEGLNNVIESTNRLIVVLNDNKMSISPNVGGLARYLNRLISGPRYNRLKGAVSRTVDRIPGIGGWLHRAIHRFQESAKHMLVPGAFFEELGFRYIGPLDGHDTEELIATLEKLKPLDHQPLLIHVLTEKGRGFAPAEEDPAAYHGLGKFDPQTGKPLPPKPPRPAVPSFGEALGSHLDKLMRGNDRVVAITAGMCDGTGLSEIRDHFPRRFFDVGIAEEHAVVFAAGMATQGLRPVVAIYATFMQRAMDYVFHDVALQNLPVVFCLDRAGVVVDGPTHHGIHDLAFWQAVPNLAILQPADGGELQAMLEFAVELERPCLIRYPKTDGVEDLPRGEESTPLSLGRAEVVRTGRDLAIWCLGYETKTGLEAAGLLAQSGVQATVVNARFVKPLDRELLCRLAEQMPVATIEDHCLGGGMGSLVNGTLTNLREARVRNFGWPEDRFVPWGSPEKLRRQFGLTAEQIAESIVEWLHALYGEESSQG